MSRTITISDDMFRMLCGLVSSGVDPARVVGDDWPRLREMFPAAKYFDLPPDEDGVPNGGWGTALMASDDYEPGEGS